MRRQLEQNITDVEQAYQSGQVDDLEVLEEKALCPISMHVDELWDQAECLRRPDLAARCERLYNEITGRE